MENITAIVDQAAAKAERRKKRLANEISQCDEEIRIIQERKRRLTIANEEYHRIASLKQNGEAVWKHLNPENKWKKENVLAVFCSGKIPDEMKEAVDWTRNVPEHIRNDRDVLLARLAHKDFANSYYYYYMRLGRAEAPQFRIPVQFLGDKEVVTRVVNRYPDVLMQDVLPQELLDDADVFRAYVRSERMKNVREQDARARIESLLSKFSARIRGNAELMLETSKRIKGTAVFDLFSGALPESCIFAIQLVNIAEKTPNNALERFSDRVKANPKVVLAFVRKNGLCLKDAAKALRGDIEIVRAACKSNAVALVHCAPGRTQWQLGRDKKFMLDIFFQIQYPGWPRRRQGYPNLYKMLVPTLKRDPECVAAAHQAQSLLISDLPPSVACNRDFWMDIIKRDSSLWHDLPKKFEGNVAFVRQIVCFKDRKLVEDVFARFPFLSKDRDIWSIIIDSGFDDALPGLITNHAPEEIRVDRELMLRACESDCEVLEVLNSQFQEDKEFVEAAVLCSSFALFSISKAAQCLYPELVAKAILNFDEEYLLDDIVENLVAEDLWSNLDVAKAWFQVGGYFHSGFPETMTTNKEFGLLVAEHGGLENFQEATSAELRSDKEFMMQAVEMDSLLLLTARRPLCQDFDLAVVAFGGSQSQDLLHGFLDDYEDDDDYDLYINKFIFLRKVFEKAHEKVKAHKGFTNGLLHGMSNHAGSECHLPMLLCGEETSLAFKKRIAEYLGVPTGKELRLLRRVTELLDDVPSPHPMEYCGCSHYSFLY